MKHLVDCLAKIKVDFFKGRKLERNIFDSTYPFFVNSVGNPYTWITVSHVSEAIGVEIKPYDFRDIVSTWGTSHECEEIRRLESKALQHDDKIAYECYKQNKALGPMTYVQKHITEQELFTDKIRSLVENDAKMKKNTRVEEEDRYEKERYIELKEKQIKEMQKKKLTRKLGPKCRISGENKKKFWDLVEDIADVNLEEFVHGTGPYEWRNWLVRLVCSSEG